jgi:AcrR family transcriptional regulator
MIAERAGLSPGGVFTTFEDKVAILCHIVGEMRDELCDRIERLTPELTGDTRERLLRVFELAHAHETPRLHLIADYIGASYGWSRQIEDEHRRLHRRLSDIIRAILQEGVRRGDIAADVDVELLLDLISAVYQRNFRTACFAGLDEASMNDRFRRQLDLVFSGARSK